MILKIEDNLILKLVDESHSQQLFNLINNDRKYLRKWLPWVDMTCSEEHTRHFIEDSQKRYLNNNSFDCAILNENLVVGIIGLHKIDHSNKVTSIGYWLGSDFQGHGYMTKSCQTLVDYCFDILDLNRIEIKCATDNLKSQGIPERLKFKREGVIRQAELLNGEFVDHLIYSKLKSERGRNLSC